MSSTVLWRCLLVLALLSITAPLWLLFATPKEKEVTFDDWERWRERTEEAAVAAVAAAASAAAATGTTRASTTARSESSLTKRCHNPTPRSWVNPFQQEALAEMYDSLSAAKTSASLAALWKEEHERVQAWLRTDAAKLDTLHCEGLEVTSLGMDFTQLQIARHGLGLASGRELLRDEDVKAVAHTYFGGGLQAFFIEVDQANHFRKRMVFPEGYLSEREAAMIASFRRDGFIQVDHYDGLDIETLKQNSRLKAVLTENSLLRKLVHGYFGGDAQYHGKNHIGLPGGVSKKDFEDSQWHHDGCGQRLQAIVFLHVMNESTHPMSIINGTHRFQWFAPTHAFATEPMKKPRIRLNSSVVMRELVARGHTVVQMLGRKGGGFVFDTNALHCEAIGPQHRARDVVVLDIAALEHMAFIPRQRSESGSGNTEKMAVIPPYNCPRSVYGERVVWEFPGKPAAKSEEELRVVRAAAAYADDRRRRAHSRKEG